MNKNQITMAAIGGVALLATLAFAYLAWSASDESAELNESLESSSDRLTRLRNAPIAPNKATVNLINDNATRLAEWTAESMVKSPGADWSAPDNLSADAFKQMVVDAAGRLRDLPGSAEEGRLVGKAFNFGFDFVNGDTMPDETKLVKLSRQWRDVESIVKLLADNGAQEVVAVTVLETKVEEKPQPAQQTRRGARVKEEEPVKPIASVERYSIRFKAAQAPLVKVINALAATEDIFVTVDTMDFARATDPLIGIQKGTESAQSGSTGGRRSRRARREEVKESSEESEEASNKKGQVINAASVEPFVATLTVSTYDFTIGEDKQ